MKRLLKFFLLAALFLSSCSFGLQDMFGRKDPVSVRVVDKNTKAVIDPAVTAPFRFIITSDVHFGSERQPDAARVAALQNVIDAENPAFAVFCGDEANSGLENEAVAFHAFADSLTNAASGGSTMPWFSAVGNHDLYNDGWQYFKREIGPSYFHIHAGSVTLYVIDTANGSVGNVQLGMIKQDFAVDPNPKIVFTHYPIRGNDAFIYGRLTGTRERAILLDLFGRSKVKAVFAGHIHYQYSTDCNAYFERVAGSLINSDVDQKGHGWIVDVDAAGNVTAREFSL